MLKNSKLFLSNNDMLLRNMIYPATPDVIVTPLKRCVVYNLRLREGILYNMGVRMRWNEVTLQMNIERFVKAE